MKKKLQIKNEPHPVKRLPIPKGNGFDQQRPSWSFRYFDHELELASGKADKTSFFEIAMHLKSYEMMTWAQIRDNHKRDHSILCEDIEKFARDRLEVIIRDDIDELFRFRINGPGRLWGIKEGSTFQVLWWDPEHEICPSAIRNT